MRRPGAGSLRGEPGDPGDSRGVSASASGSGRRRPGPLLSALRAAAESDLDRAERLRRVADLAGALGDSARTSGARAVASGRWLTDVVVQAVPQVPIRDLPTLHAHHPGLDGRLLLPDELAEALVRTASRATGGIGAAGGAVAGVQWAAPPALLAAPLLLAAETLTVIALEVKLVGELHAVYGRVPPGSPRERGVAYVIAWAQESGVDLAAPATLRGMVPAAVRRELRTRVLRRMGRSTGSLAPFFTGAALGAELNRRRTRRLGQAVIDDVRRRGPVLVTSRRVRG